MLHAESKMERPRSSLCGYFVLKGIYCGGQKMMQNLEGLEFW